MYVILYGWSQSLIKHNAGFTTKYVMKLVFLQILAVFKCFNENPTGIRAFNLPVWIFS